MPNVTIPTHLHKKDNNQFHKLCENYDFLSLGTFDKLCNEDNGTPICAGGLYIGEGTQFAFMEWIVTDKNADARRTHTALKMCIDRIMDLAKSKGIKLVYTATKEQALHKRYTKYHDMVLTETNVKTFIRDLDGSYSEDLAWISDDEQIESRNK